MRAATPAALLWAQLAFSFAGGSASLPLAGQTPPPLGPPAAPVAQNTDDATAAVRDDYLRQRSRFMFELNAWGDASLIGSGLAFLAARSAFARGVELQAAVWGLGDAAVALFHLWQAKRHPAEGESLTTWVQLRREAHRGHRMDAAIDVGLLAVALVAWRLLRGARWRGMAAGIALQCGFLALFNLLASLAFGA